MFDPGLLVLAPNYGCEVWIFDALIDHLLAGFRVARGELAELLDCVRDAACEGEDFVRQIDESLGHLDADDVGQVF
ncbi:hypothetical protein D3C85_643990 [compost metagenome]